MGSHRQGEGSPDETRPGPLLSFTQMCSEVPRGPCPSPLPPCSPGPDTRHFRFTGSLGGTWARRGVVRRSLGSSTRGPGRSVSGSRRRRTESPGWSFVTGSGCSFYPTGGPQFYPDRVSGSGRRSGRGSGIWVEWGEVRPSTPVHGFETTKEETKT